MHACLAVTTEGLPLGLLSQKIVARESKSTRKKAAARDHLPIEEKESYRWLESLKVTTEAMGEPIQINAAQACLLAKSGKSLL